MIFLMPHFSFQSNLTVVFGKMQLTCVTSLRMWQFSVKFGYFSLVFSLFLPFVCLDNLRCKIANLVLFTLYGFNDGYIVPSLRVARVFMPKSTQRKFFMGEYWLKLNFERYKPAIGLPGYAV